MQRMPALSRLAMRRQLSLGARRSPIEIVATMGTYVTRTQAAEVSGLRTGPFGRWADGVTAMREDCAAVPDGTIILDLPLPAGCWGLIGRASPPYVGGWTAPSTGGGRPRRARRRGVRPLPAAVVRQVRV